MAERHDKDCETIFHFRISEIHKLRTFAVAWWMSNIFIESMIHNLTIKFFNAYLFSLNKAMIFNSSYPSHFLWESKVRWRCLMVPWPLWRGGFPKKYWRSCVGLIKVFQKSGKFHFNMSSKFIVLEGSLQRYLWSAGEITCNNKRTLHIQGARPLSKQNSKRTHRYHN